MVCLVHQANYTLDRQLRALEKEFLKEGAALDGEESEQREVSCTGKKIGHRIGHF
jgi:hypothetical protein